MFLVTDDGALEIVKGKVIGNLVSVGVFNDVAPDNLLLGFLLRRHPVLELGLVEDLCHIHALKVSL